MCQVKHAVLPVSSRTSNFEDVEIELQQLNTCMQIRDCIEPFLGSKNEFGRRLTLRFFFVQALANKLRMNQTITLLMLAGNKIGDDGLKAWWWWNTGMWGASMGSNPRSFFSGSMWRPFADRKSWFKTTCEISKHHKLLQVWNSNLFFNVWFLLCHESSAWHSAYISSTFAGLRIRLLDSFLQNYDIVLENGSGDSFRKINLSGKVVQAG